MASCGSRRAGTPSAASTCAAVALALLFTAGAGAESKPPRVAAAVDEAAPALDGRPDADRLADVLAGLVGGPLREATGLGDVELADLLEEVLPLGQARESRGRA